MRNVILEALAGTGKTTSICEGLKLILNGHCGITPSPEQQAFWDALPRVRSYAVVAFNKSIATTLKTRLPAGVDSCTLHSLGFAAVRKAFGNKLRVEAHRTDDLLVTICGRVGYNDLRAEFPVALNTIRRLVSLCKLTLRTDLGGLADEFDLDDGGAWRAVEDLVPLVLKLARDPRNDGAIDYDDMVWLPVERDLPVAKYDCLIVDEAQDLNACQQALTRKAGRTLVYVGDKHQAIYGFAGADTASLDRLAKELDALVLPLSVTRRCSRAVVREANTLVPRLTAHESNAEGEVRLAQYPRQGVSDDATYLATVKVGDMVVCRTNAPLVSQCFRLLARGVKATIQGRDIGANLIATITKLKAKGVPALIEKLGVWLTKELDKEGRKERPNEAKLLALQDRYDCLLVFIDGCDTVPDVKARIEKVFTDDKDAPGVRLSSIHKAKGLEAEDVYYLQPKDARGPRPTNDEAAGQELNLRYVAITRAIHTLTHVTG